MRVLTLIKAACGAVCISVAQVITTRHLTLKFFVSGCSVPAYIHKKSFENKPGGAA